MKTKPYGIIYLLIDCTNDFEYVGQTTQTFERRFSQHKYGNQYIDHIIQKRGEDLIEAAILKVCCSKEELDYWEKHFIKSRDTKIPNGYNIADGGEIHSGWHYTPKERARRSAAMKGNRYGLGYHHTKKTRAIMSLSHTGKKFSAEHRTNLSAATMGHEVSDETRAKLKASMTGEKHPFFGKHHRGESKTKSSVSQRQKSPFKNLLSEMDKVHISYRELAKILGLSSSGASYRMRGKYKFTTNDIDKLVEIFNKPAEYLMQRDD